MKNKVAIYARVSTAEMQDYQRQINELKEIINKDYQNTDIEIDEFAEKISGYKSERLELNNLLNKATDYDCIYISEISRLGRNPSHTRRIIDELTDKGVGIYIQNIGQRTISPNGERNGTMQIVLQVLMEFADQEVKTLKTRIKSGKKQAVKSGKVSTGIQLYGYKNENGYMTIDENESKIVKEIFDDILNGYTTTTITKKLNENNIPTKYTIVGGDDFKVKNTTIKQQRDNIKWTVANVRRMINNTAYYGKRKYKDEYIDAPAIIDEATFIKANNIISKRENKKEQEYIYLLTNITKCGCCNHKYMGYYHTAKYSNKSYICYSQRTTNKCESGGIYIRLIESVLFQIFTETDISNYIKDVNGIKEQLISIKEQLAIELSASKNQLIEKEKEQNKILELYVKGTFPVEKLDEMNDSINKEIIKLNNEILSIEKKKVDNEISLRNYNKKTTSKTLFQQAKNNRKELQNLFRQILNKVIITQLNEYYHLISVQIKVNGIILPNYLHIVVNNYANRKNRSKSERDYLYLSDLNTLNVLYNEDFILTNREEVLNNLIDNLSLNYSNDEVGLQFKNVKEENRIFINESDI